MANREGSDDESERSSSFQEWKIGRSRMEKRNVLTGEDAERTELERLQEEDEAYTAGRILERRNRVRTRSDNDDDDEDITPTKKLRDENYVSPPPSTEKLQNSPKLSASFSGLRIHDPSDAISWSSATMDNPGIKDDNLNPADEIRRQLEFQTSPRKSEISPRKSGISPRKSGISPRKCGISPRKSGFSPKKFDFSPKKFDFSPQKSGISPQKSLMDTNNPLDLRIDKENTYTLKIDPNIWGAGKPEDNLEKPVMLDKSVWLDRNNSNSSLSSIDRTSQESSIETGSSIRTSDSEAAFADAEEEPPECLQLEGSKKVYRPPPTYGYDPFASNMQGSWITEAKAAADVYSLTGDDDNG